MKTALSIEKYGISTLSHLINVSAAHNSYTSLDSDFVGPQNKRSCICIILKNLPSIDFGHSNLGHKD